MKYALGVLAVCASFFICGMFVQKHFNVLKRYPQQKEVTLAPNTPWPVTDTQVFRTCMKERGWRSYPIGFDEIVFLKEGQQDLKLSWGKFASSPTGYTFYLFRGDNSVTGVQASRLDWLSGLATRKGYIE